MKRFFVLALLIASLVPAAKAAGFKIVVHPDNPVQSMSIDEVAAMMLKTTTSWAGGTAIVPVDQVDTAPVRQAFSRTILRRKTMAVRSYWRQRLFAGVSVPPPELDSDAEVLAYVRRHRGAIGYVSENAPTTGARVVTLR